MLKLALLGPFQAELNGSIVEGFVSTKAQALLCYLALTGKVHSRQTLATMFWGETSEEKAFGALRVALSNLRKLTPGYLKTTRLDVAFNSEVSCQIDALELLDVAGRLQTAGIEELEGAVALLRGEFLEAFFLDGAPEFEEWLFSQRAQMQEAALQVLDRLAGQYHDARRPGDVVRILRQILRREPWDEGTHRRLMETLARMGEFNAALAQFEQCSRALETEFGVEPMPETLALYRRIQTARRQQAYLLPGDDAPFVGRNAELARILTMLADPECRLLSVVGLGGSGKTRLALAAARQAADEHHRMFLNGIVFVPLAAARSPVELGAALAGALGLLLEGNESAERQLLTYLAGLEALIVLDNLEHLASETAFLQRLIQNAPDVKLLVTSREPLHLQSEWRVDLEGMGYPAQNGAGAAEIMSFDAVTLFVQSARQAQPEFRLDDRNAADVARICRLVAGMPLGVKLAAAWSRAMSPAEIAREIEHSADFLAARYHDLPRRHHSLRAVFESTYARLSTVERQAFAALFVFCGGFTPAAAGEVAELQHASLLELVDRGLVQRLGSDDEARRFDLHPLMRQFAGEKLEEAGHFERFAEQHCRYYLKLVASMEAGLFGPTPQFTIATLQPELDNLRQAWEWAVARRHFQVLRDAADVLAALFEFTVHFSEGEKLFAAAVRALEDQPRSPTRDACICAMLVHQIGLALDRGVTDVSASLDKLETLAWGNNDHDRLADMHRFRGRQMERLQGYDAAVVHQEEALAAYEQQNRPRHLAMALNELGHSLAHANRPDGALALHRRAFQVAGAIGDIRNQVLTLTFMGVDSFYLNQYGEALSFWREALAQLEVLKDERAIARTSNNVCYVQNMLGNYEEALQDAERLQALLPKLGDHLTEADIHDTLAEIYFALGDYSQARYHYTRAVEHARAGSLPLKEAWYLTGLAELDIASGRLGFAEGHLQRAWVMLEQEGHARDRVRTLAALGELYRCSGRTEQAIAFYEQAVGAMAPSDEPIFMAPLLVRAGELFMESGDLARAEALLQRGLSAAQSIGRQPAVLRARLLLAQLAKLRDDSSAISMLEDLLVTARRDSERADVLYALWGTSGKKDYGLQALGLYQTLAAETPNMVFRKRREELEETCR